MSQTEKNIWLKINMKKDLHPEYIKSSKDSVIENAIAQ